MKSTQTFHQPQRFIAVAIAVALTGMMLAADSADAGHRRRNRCYYGLSYNARSSNVGYGYGGGYGNRGGYGGYGYGQQGGYGYNNAGYGINAYAGNQQYGINGSAGYQNGVQGGVQYGNSSSAQGDIEPNLAVEGEQGTQIRANRPITDGAVPPSPALDGQATADADAQSNLSTDSSAVRQMQQQIDSLQQENARLKSQLESAQPQE